MSYSGLRGTTRSLNKGKFRHIHRPGVEDRGEHEYQGMHYTLHHAHVGVTSRRDSYSLTIRDIDGRTLEHLTGLANMMQAHRAAQRWIDRTLVEREQIHSRRLSGRRRGVRG